MQIGAQTYNVVVRNATSATGKSGSYIFIYWQDTNSISTDAAATFASPGDTTIFPQIKAKNGEYIIFVNNYNKIPVSSNISNVIVPYQGTTKEEKQINFTTTVDG